ncbi:MAG: hypothetical protein LBJ90_02670 [Treponema sp.]|jgi:transglutaminase-like putative cysteine protease/tetratricopeptide (TPR) repeat protein|nr:hypothetical protein [Treponema sp.]
MKPQNLHPSASSLVLRSTALFAVFFQFRLLADDLADTPVFVAALLAAFAAAAVPGCFAKAKTAAGAAGGRAAVLPVLIAIALIPWLARALIAIPRLFLPGGTGGIAITLDSLLLNLDRNNFVSLLPFYWTAASTLFAIRSRKALRAAIVADGALLITVFSIARASDLYRWPVIMILVFSGIVFLQLCALVFSLPPELRLRGREKASALAALLLLIVLGSLLFLGPSQERAVEKGGGLLEPKLFSFDFSQFLRLDTEISMNDDLVLIVKKDGDDDHILLRRSVLSGYSRRRGFYKIEELDERTHPQRLPDRPAALAAYDRPAPVSSRPVQQEYFLVNFDAAAFIGMNQPIRVSPYENWDASSFSSAYGVESLVNDAFPAELSHSVANWPSAAVLGLDENEFEIYTGYGDDERIRAYAEEITRGLDRYSDKVRAVHDRLKYGEYRYSLKPGIAPDGDQLSWFLFGSKKGYCSYYAFAMTLLLRSLGIPARVAAGFFIDPASNTFDYYPVRSDMAHAWVEVPYPGYGWVEYDPTSENLAEGEDFRFSAGVDPKLFEKLMREILENRSRIVPKQGTDAAAPPSNMASLACAAAAMLRTYWPPLLLAALALVFIFLRCGFLFAAALNRNPRKKALRLWEHARRRLRLAGLRRIPGEAESEWALALDLRVRGVYGLYRDAAAARFAPEFSAGDFSVMCNNYRAFSAAFGGRVSFGRRLVSWLFPPLALALRPGPLSGHIGDADRFGDAGHSGDAGGAAGDKADKGRRGGPAALLLLLALIGLGASETRAQDEAGESAPSAESGAGVSAADDLYNRALDAEFAEYWEKAIELFKEGNVLYPEDPRFPWELGDLYYSRSLYGLAWEEYRKTEAIIPYQPDLLLRLSKTAGYLNRDRVSVEYLERLLRINPDNKEAIGNLGWMYYKVHRLADGERLLSAAIERFGEDSDLSMTLGTIYADLYHYDEGKDWYKKAIALGESLGDRVFAAVARYNLSILEARFFRFDLSLEETNASLESQNRASGHLARGELYLRRLDLERSRKDYEAAYEIDTSPLAKINRAQIYQISGRLEEARLYAEDCLRQGDLSWMLNYGIDPDRYKRDIHDILHKTYEGLAKAEQFVPWGKTGEKIRSVFRRISYSFKSAVHYRLYHKYSLAAADAYGPEIYEGGSPHLDSFIQYYNAFESYPRRANAYLKRAKEFESALIPAVIPSYDLEEGILFKKEELLNRALAGLDPVWERELISRCFLGLALYGKTGGQDARRHAAEEAFSLNRGALLQAGLALPLEIHLAFDALENEVSDRASAPPSGRGGVQRNILRALKKAGFDAGALPRGSARYTLDIRIGGSAAAGYAADCELRDREDPGGTLRRSVPLRSLSKTDICAFARDLGNMVFRVE